MNNKNANWLAGYFDNENDYMEFLNERIAHIDNSKTICRIETGDLLPYDVVEFEAGNLILALTEGEKTKEYRGLRNWRFSDQRIKITNYTGKRGPRLFKNDDANSYTLNLFTGFAGEPREDKEKAQFVSKYIFTNLCASNLDRYEAIERILAWQVQNVGEASGVIILLKSEVHGVGKSIFKNFLVDDVWGNSGLKVSEIEHFTGRFNANIAGKYFVGCEEVGFSGNQREANKIKDLSTSKDVRIEVKGGGTFTLPCGFNFIMCTNQDTGAHIEEHDRRYFLLDMDHLTNNNSLAIEFVKRTKDKAYGLAYLHYLLKLELPANYHPSQDVKYSCDKSSFISKSNYSSFKECFPEDKIIPAYTIIQKDGVNYVRASWFTELYKNYLGASYNMKRESNKKISDTLLKEGFGETQVISVGGQKIRVREISPHWQIESTPEMNYNSFFVKN